MEDRRAPGIDRLEQQVDELERLTDTLGEVPDEEVVAVLARAVELLQEINSGIEAGLASSQQGAQDVSALLERVNLGPFDEALEEIEQKSGEPGA
ncbi:MAG TPA: hypothetical protein VFJ72_05450 [Rubrobacteraceae bacterium]|nr:hypothetical protein [Rubrobacteraceae bacterium]